MSVTRYGIYACCEEMIVEHADGDYVKFDDYAELKNERDEAVKRGDKLAAALTELCDSAASMEKKMDLLSKGGGN
jgi:hypothetical protein